jgi:uncharacterized protein with ParB-like and HNH nuclease domain
MSEGVNITADETTIDDVLTRNHCFQIPSYQRQYSWGEEQWTDLWNDLQDLESDEMHFLGSIVVITNPYEIANSNVLQLVDGQQRLSTLAILLCVLREKYERFELPKKSSHIHDRYLYEEGFDQTQPKIRLGNLDDEQFQKILTGSYERVDSEYPLRKAYDYFSSKLENAQIDKIHEVREKLLKQLTVVVIRSNSETSAFRLFETLNDRGLELSSIDLMKNFLLKESHENNNINTELIKNTWERIIENIHGLNKPIRFFRHYITSAPEPQIDDRVTETKVYDVFKSIIEDKLDRESMTLEEYIVDMEKQSRRYTEIVYAEIGKFSRDKNNVINKNLMDLKHIKAIPSRPLLLRSFREIKNPDDIIDIINMIEKYTIRARISGYSTGNDGRLYDRLSTEIFGLRDPLDYLRSELIENAPSDDVFVTNFIDNEFVLNKRTKFILDSIEQYEYMGTESGKKIAGRDQVHIEHIALYNR